MKPERIIELYKKGCSLVALVNFRKCTWHEGKKILEDSGIKLERRDYFKTKPEKRIKTWKICPVCKNEFYSWKAKKCPDC